jgi:hypothetical protein
MSSRWMLRHLVLVAALLTFPVSAIAQTSRVEGMALQHDYLNDYSNIYTYTSKLSNVGNLVYGELGNLLTNDNTGRPVTLDRSVGVVLGTLWDGRLGTWGVHLREETPALGQGDAFAQPNPGFGGFDPNGHTNESFDVMWGRKFGTTSVGLRLNRSFYEFEDELAGVTTTLSYDVPGSLLSPTGDPNLARNILGLGGGIGFEMNPNTNVELALLYQSRTFESSVTGGTTTEDDNPSTWMVSGRAMWQWMSNVMVVPVFKYYAFDLSTQSTAVGGATTTIDNQLRGWQAGIAGNWTLGSNDLMVLGVTVAQNRIEQEEDLFGFSAGAGLGDSLEITETLAPQVFAALETHVNNWLTLRMGANKGAFQIIKAEDRGFQAQEQKVTLASFNMNIGAGVKIGTLQLDAILNELFPQTLGGFFSNLPGGLISFPKVTATYAF